MKYSNLEKAAKILPHLKELDNEIIKLEKTALLIAEGKASSVFELKVNDSTTIREQKIVLDGEGSLLSNMEDSLYNMMRRSLTPHLGVMPNVKPDNYDFEFKYKLDEITLLRLLSVLKMQKEEERVIYVRKLEKLGFTNS